MPAQGKLMEKFYSTVQIENGTLWDRIVLEKPLEPCRKASEKEVFDYCIKTQLLSGGYFLPGYRLASNDESNFGYYLERHNRYYDRYLSKNNNLESIISHEIKKHFDEGKGNEFKTGKFYSVASSSRFAVASFSEGSQTGKIELVSQIKINGKLQDVCITLEEGLHIEEIPQNRTPPQMDVVIRTKKNETFFIETKCHEIFDTSEHKEIKLKYKYLETAAFKRFPVETSKLSKSHKLVNGKNEEYLSLDGNYLKAKDFGCQLLSTHFDLKQFLCHLMGIVSYGKRNPKEKLHFYYLYFKNEQYIRMCNSNIYSDLEMEMSIIFSIFSKLFPEIEFGYQYNSEFNTLKNIKKMHITTAST